MKEKKIPPRGKKNEEHYDLRISTILIMHPAAPPEQAADGNAGKKRPYRTSYSTARCVENTPKLKTACLSLRPKKMKAFYLLHKSLQHAVSEDYVMSSLVQTAAYSLLIPVTLSICFLHRDLRHLTSSFLQTKE